MKDTNNELLLKKIMKSFESHQDDYLITTDMIKDSVKSLVKSEIIKASGNIHDNIIDHFDEVPPEVDSLLKYISEHFCKFNKDGRKNYIDDRIDLDENEELEVIFSELDDIKEKSDLDEFSGRIEEVLEDENGAFEDLSRQASSILDYHLNDKEMIRKFLTKLAYAEHLNEGIEENYKLGLTS